MGESVLDVGDGSVLGWLKGKPKVDDLLEAIFSSTCSLVTWFGSAGI